MEIPLDFVPWGEGSEHESCLDCPACGRAVGCEGQEGGPPCYTVPCLWDAVVSRGVQPSHKVFQKLQRLKWPWVLGIAYAWPGAWRVGISVWACSIVPCSHRPMRDILKQRDAFTKGGDVRAESMNNENKSRNV